MGNDLPDAAQFEEFKRLWDEAVAVALTADEFKRLIYAAAVKLASGEWLPPVCRSRSVTNAH